VVIAIISLLASIVFASLATARSKARDAKRIQDLTQLRNALELYALNNGGLYPERPSIGSGRDYNWHVSCWECADVLKIFKDIGRLSVLSPYLNPRPVDPSNPNDEEYLDESGYWYKVSTDRRNYKFSLIGTFENYERGGDERITSVDAPESFLDIYLFGDFFSIPDSKVILSIYSSEDARRWSLQAQCYPGNPSHEPSMC